MEGFKICISLILPFVWFWDVSSDWSSSFPVHPSLPVPLWAALLDLLSFGSPLAAHAVDAARSGHSLRLQTFGWLFEGKLNCLTLLQAAEAFHVQLTLKGNTGRFSGIPGLWWFVCVCEAFTTFGRVLLDEWFSLLPITCGYLAWYIEW